MVFKFTIYDVHDLKANIFGIVLFPFYDESNNRKDIYHNKVFMLLGA